MHGRLKVKTTKEQEAEKQKERAKKLAAFRAGTSTVFTKRTNGEYDTEALNVTQQLLSANPDFYTLWNFRKEILLNTKDSDLKKLFSEELALTETCLRVNPKSYGTWHHRCWTLNTMPNTDWLHEMKLCNQYLELDERNFHCWDYRRLITKKAGIVPKDELEFTMHKINLNFSNYSSWHYRSKLLPLVYPRGEGDGCLLREDKYLEELELVQNAAFTDPNDQSAWFYHRWLLGRIDKPLAIRSVYVDKKTFKFVVALTQELLIGSDSFAFKLSVNENILTDVVWRPSHPELRSTNVWFVELPNAVFKTENVQQNLFRVDLEKEDKHTFLDIVLDADVNSAWNQRKNLSGFRLELSTAASDILQRELDSCRQLQEFEPDNKWMLLTMVLLMRAIDPSKYNLTIESNLSKLMEIDTYRKCYYEDLRSKFVLEDVIETLPVNIHEIRINDRNLTTLYHLDHLTQITSLDVSNNHLSSLSTLHLLQCLRKLVADNNAITNCSGLTTLRHLEHVSLANNQIENEDGLKPLCDKRNLRVLVLTNNGTCNNELAVQWIHESLHFVIDLVL